MKIEIKNRITDNVIFSHEQDNNSIKVTVEKAVKLGISLNGASLNGASLDGASLDGASLDGASLDGASLYYASLNYASLNGASLNGASLDGALLNGASLDYASLDGASLDGASLDYASLDGASLDRASLDGASLNYASLDYASLDRALLDYASLNYASLNGASLDGASLNYASLNGAKNTPFVPLSCPSDGAFIGWKKVKKNDISYLVELYIPEDARRSSATTNKCRCDKAKVLSITRIYDLKEMNKVTNYNYAVTTYEVGRIVTPDSFDDNRWDECSNGIHFFINKQEAINY